MTRQEGKGIHKELSGSKKTFFVLVEGPEKEQINFLRGAEMFQ